MAAILFLYLSKLAFPIS